MLSRMPVVSENFTRFEFELRDDLFFHPDACFSDKRSRKVTAEDVKFSLLRFADVRLHSPVYWMFRGKIKELDKFREASRRRSRDDMSIYDMDIDGIKIISSRKFVITLEKPDPRFLYMFATPNAGIVSRRAVERYGRNISHHPVGSGPFILTNW